MKVKVGRTMEIMELDHGPNGDLRELKDPAERKELYLHLHEKFNGNKFITVEGTPQEIEAKVAEAQVELVG